MKRLVVLYVFSEQVTEDSFRRFRGVKICDDNLTVREAFEIARKAKADSVEIVEETV